MDNKKEKPNTINNINKSIGQGGIFSENDPIDVNNLLTLADSDITPDLLIQLEQRAKEEQDKMNLTEKKEEKENPLQENIQIPEGLPAENGAVNITGEIMERPKTPEDETPPPPPPQEQSIDPLEEAKMNAVYKKYVIYIDKDNEKYIDSLSIAERKQLINEVLHDQRNLSEAQRREQQRKEAVAKLMLGIVTFIIAVPLIYLIFNISMEATIQNYKHSKSNFEVLYKETGKIKINN